MVDNTPDTGFQQPVFLVTLLIKSGWVSRNTDHLKIAKARSDVKTASARKHDEIYIKSIVSQPIHARLLQPMTNT